jgi:hypothetical protein
VLQREVVEAVGEREDQLGPFIGGFRAETSSDDRARSRPCFDVGAGQCTKQRDDLPTDR